MLDFDRLHNLRLALHEAKIAREESEAIENASQHKSDNAPDFVFH